MNKKVATGIIIATLVILAGGVWLLSKQGNEKQVRLNKPLVGQEIPIQSRDHVPNGTQISYSTNPPAGGSHYATPQPAGIYDTPPPDGNLVHSLEHGAVIIWYKPLPTTTLTPISESSESAKLVGLSPQDIDQLKQIFNSLPVSKKIMVPRDSLDVPVALTSWGKLLKLQSIDENQIKTFMETNEDRAPEQAPL